LNHWLEEAMKLQVVRFGCAVSAVWGLTLMCVGVANLLVPGYGEAFLRLFDSIYPGYHYGQWGFWGVLVAVGYGVLDGWIAGVLLAWLYNKITRQ